MKWPSHHVNVIQNQKVIPVWNSHRCKFSHVNTPLDDKVNIGAFPWCKKAVFRMHGLLIYTWIITQMNHPTLHSKRWLWWHDLYPAPDPGEGYFWEFLVGVCHLVLQILTLFQTKKCHFPLWFSDISKIHTYFQAWSHLACSRLSDSWGDSPVFSRFIFVFMLSQFSGSNYLGAWNRLGLISQKSCHHYQIRV